jgi:hypothetical protein
MLLNNEKIIKWLEKMWKWQKIGIFKNMDLNIIVFTKFHD